MTNKGRFGCLGIFFITCLAIGAANLVCQFVGGYLAPAESDPPATPGQATHMIPRTKSSGSGKAPPATTAAIPGWMQEGQVIYLPAVIGFRIERDDLHKWPLPFADLHCENTAYCVYALDICEPLRITWRASDYIELASPAGPAFDAVAPWDLAFRGRKECLASALGRDRGRAIAVQPGEDRFQLAR